jgi:flagellar biosynthesis protein FlhG
MTDQADELRRLMFRAAQPTVPGAGGARTLVVSGGRPGVGATTLAVNLAVALAHDALRVVLVDADMQRAEVAPYCGISGGLSIHEVFAGRRSIHEALQLGPAGMQVVAGSAAPETRAAVSERSIRRLLRQVQSLAPHADWLLIDAGNQPCELAARLWSAADAVLLATAPDAVSVMDAYALIKTLLTRQTVMRPLKLVVNRLDDDASAADVHRRIDQSCRRFLGLSIGFAGAVPYDPVAVAGGKHPPAVLAEPDSLLASAVQRLARRLVEHPEPQVIDHRRAA